jgi:peptidoglycan/LPS O-acetylase OafA/YrhL
MLSTPRRNRRDEFPALTGIRFPLALWVVAYHLSGPGRMLDSLTSRVPVLETLTSSAWVALGTFFAISGFVLTRGYRTTKWNRDVTLQYAVNRFARVYPVYLISLLILAPIINQAVRNDPLGSLADRAGLVLNYCLILQGWARPPVDWNTPAWSLSCEVFFYLCFPAAVLLLRQVTWKRVLLMIGLAFAVPVAVRLLQVPTSCKPLIYLGDFLLGIGAAGLYEILKQQGTRLSGRGYWLYTPASIAGIALLLNTSIVSSFLVYDTGLRLVNGALVLGLALGGGFGCGALSSPLAIWGGRASYAIYILHIPILWWYKRTPAYLDLPPVWAGFIYVAIVLAVSFAVCAWYERPVDRFLRRKLSALFAPSRSPARELQTAGAGST